MSKELEVNAPKVIYLQIGDDHEGEYSDEATWCADKIHNTDIAFVLKSYYDALQAKLTEAEQLITDLKNHQKVLEELYESAWRETSKYRDVMVMHHGLFNDIIELAKQNVTVPEVQKVPWKRFGSDSNDNH